MDQTLWSWIWTLIDFILHIDRHVDTLIASYGVWAYGMLACIIFCETGLIFMPLLPGDSLLFAFGAVAARGEHLNIHLLFALASVAAILGDGVNYHTGQRLGSWIKQHGWIHTKHLERTTRFYKTYGVKTIVFARFVPIVRTFAPFVGGLGGMAYGTFFTWNVIGGVLWSGLFLYAGYLFGNLTFVRQSFTLVLLSIIAISCLPMLYEWFREWFRAKGNKAHSDTENGV